MDGQIGVKNLESTGNLNGKHKKHIVLIEINPKLKNLFIVE